MASCFTNVQPINPINELILSVFGENYFPPYSTEFQPPKKSELTNETLLQMQFPGGGKAKPLGTDVHNSLADYVSTITGLLGSVFNFFGPIFIILDVIRALIDMICSLFNPVPLIATVVEFFITVVPPLIALYPPLSSILLSINTVKLVTSIMVTMLSYIIPIIDKIVSNALSIPGLIASGNLAAIEGVNIKICTLLQYFDNQIGALTPIQFILELLQLFSNLAASFFCIQESPCCDAENCPPIIVNAPTGVARVTRLQEKFTLKDLLDFIAIPINLVLDAVEYILNLIVDGFNDILEQTFPFIEDIVGRIVDNILALLFIINQILDIPVVGALGLNVDDIITALGADPDDPASIINNSFSLNLPESLPASDIQLSLEAPDFFEDFVFIREELDLGLFKEKTSSEYGSSFYLKDPVASVNDAGRVSEKAPGDPYTQEEMVALLNFLVDPEKIPAAQDNDNPATLYVRMKRIQRADGTLDGNAEEIVRPLAYIPPNLLEVVLSTFGVDFTEPFLDTITVRSEDFDDGDIIEYKIEPDQIALLSLNLIGLGCQDDIASVAEGVKRSVNADLEAVDVVGGDADSGLDPLRDKIGRDFPEPPVQQLQECLARQTANPDVSQADCINDVIQDYLDDLVDYYDSLLCAGASRVSSVFEVDKEYAVADGEDSVTIVMQVNDFGGNNLMLGKIPTSTAKAEFFATNGAIVGPVIFDDETATFRATLTSTSPGTVEVTGQFLINDVVCLIPADFDGFNVTDKIIEVEFLPKGGVYPRRRRQRIYRQARGGKRR